MNPTSKTLTIVLGGKKYKLFFDLNTFEKYEELTGKTFTEFLAGLQESVLRAKESGNEMDFLRGLHVKDVKAFLYAALHTYTADDEPIWPLTMGQLGRLVNTDNLQQVVSTLMQGQSENQPSEDEMPASMKAGAARPPEATVVEIPAVAGGEESGVSDADALASLTVKSGG